MRAGASEPALCARTWGGDADGGSAAAATAAAAAGGGLTIGAAAVAAAGSVVFVAAGVGSGGVPAAIAICVKCQHSGQFCSVGSSASSFISFARLNSNFRSLRVQLMLAIVSCGVRSSLSTIVANMSVLSTSAGLSLE